MKKLALLISCLCFAQTLAYGQKGIILWDAFQTQKISITANWNSPVIRSYGQNLFVKVTNNQKEKIKILILPGETFLSENPLYQNQIVVKADTLILAPNASDTVSLYSMCIGHNKQCPGGGNSFSLIAQKDVILIDIVTYIAQYGYYGSSTAQAAVWTVQGSTSISTIYSTDSIMARGLASRAAELTHQPVPDYIPVREHHIVILNGNFNYQAVRPVTVTLGVYDSTGRVVNLLMNKQLLPAGFHTFNYHANEVAPEGSTFLLKMTDDKGAVLYSKSLTENDTESSQTFSQRIIYTFTLDKAYKDLNLGIYDAQGNLMTEIFGYRPWSLGTYNINYTLFHDRQKDSVFYVRLMGKDKKIVAQKVVRKKTEADGNYPEEVMNIQLKYPVTVKTEQTKCVIYNEFGDEIAVVFKDKKLNPGPNEIKYKLTHTYGKNARFVIQVQGPTGQILYSKEIVQTP